MTDGSFSFCDAEIAYTDVGRGAPALLFCHGNSASRRTFDELISLLSEDYRCYSLDFYGHGDSSLPSTDACTLRGYSDLCRAFIAAREVDECVLVGHSLGGHAVMEALPHLSAGRVRGAVMISAPPFSRDTLSDAFRDPVDGLMFQAEISPTQAERIAGALVKTSAVSNASYRAVIARVLATDGSVRQRIGQVVAQGEFDDERVICATTTLPLHFIQGSEDPFVNQEYLSSVRGHDGRAIRGTLIVGAQHCPHQEQPKQTAASIRAFLATLR